MSHRGPLGVDSRIRTLWIGLFEMGGFERLADKVKPCMKLTGSEGAEALI